MPHSATGYVRLKLEAEGIRARHTQEPRQKRSIVDTIANRLKLNSHTGPNPKINPRYPPQQREGHDEKSRIHPESRFASGALNARTTI